MGGTLDGESCATSTITNGKYKDEKVKDRFHNQGRLELHHQYEKEEYQNKNTGLNKLELKPNH